MDNMEQLATPLPDNPLPILASWLDDARASKQYPNPDAMALATVDAEGLPATRIVLCKELACDPGYAVFYTNYASAKGDAIAATGAVAAVFHWDRLNRQARLEGVAVKSPAAESDAYFSSRDRDSQIGAWASAQSQAIEEREQLLRALQAMQQRFAGETIIPRPPHWGGYRVWLTAVELWTRGDARLHDRGRWERRLGDTDDGCYSPEPWHSCRLQP